MKRKSGRLIVSVVVFLLATAAYLGWTNWGYILEYRQGFQAEALGQVEFVNWQKDGAAYISQADPQLVFAEASGYTHMVQFRCAIDAEQLVPAVFFVPHGQTDYVAENCFVPEYDYDGEVLSIRIDQDVAQFRIDLTDAPGFVFDVSQMRRLTQAFRLDMLGLLLAWFAAGAVLLPLYASRGTGHRIGVMWQGLQRYRFLLWNLVKKDITTKYRRSVLGILWSVLNPLLMMLVITAVFQHIFRFSIENFALYYLTGSLIFNFVAEATTGAMTSVLGSAALIKKVYIPKYIFPLEKCLFALINALFSMIAVVLIFLITSVTPPATALLFPIPMLYAFVFSVGLGMILATLEVFFRDVGHLYSVWVTAWMYLTPVIYPMDILPEAMLLVLQLNPLYYYVEYFRNIMLYGIMPDLWLNAVCALFSLGCLGLGLAVFKKSQDRFILHM